MKRACLVVLALWPAAACGGSEGDQRDQWSVTVSTDAPLPTIGDRLLVELLRPDGSLACAGCRRQLGAEPESWPISFGVLPPPNHETLRVRVRLFRATSAGQDGLPTTGGLFLDALGELPSPDGVTHASLELRMSCFGVPSDVDGDLTCDPTTGTLAPTPRLQPPTRDLPNIDSWAPAAVRPCQGALPDGMACVNGGVFVLGQSREPAFYIASPQYERLVRLDAFAMDRREVRVEEVRELMLSGKILGSPSPFVDNPTSQFYSCRFLGIDDDSHDALPVNCISQSTADAVCRVRGARLPTEAEWEFAASNRGSARAYPWGDENDVCERAMVGRSPGLIGNFGGDSSCKGDEPPTGVPGPIAESFPGDLNELGLHDLGGNLAEWTLDELANYDDECWHPERTLLENPECQGTTSIYSAVRGGNWSFPPISARLRQRAGNEEPGNTFIGLRCVMPMP